MAVHITNVVHEGVDHTGQPYREHERHAAGKYNWAAIFDEDIILTIGGMPDLELTWERVWDLREVLDAALTLRHK